MRVATLLILLLGRAVGQNAPPEATFRSGTSLVRVDALALDGSRVLSGLRKDDFVILDDAAPQPILHFEVENNHLDLLLLIDKSCSMMPVVAEIAVSAVEALTVLREGDRVGVMLFDQKRDLVIQPTAKMEEVAAALENAVRPEAIGGGTDINNAVLDAARFLRRQPRTDARRSILILTDNRSFKATKDSTVVRELWEADAVLNALIFQSGFGRAVHRYRQMTNPAALVFGLFLEANVNRIVEQTGGESLQSGTPLESFREMLERIRKRYSLHYRPPAAPAGQRRSIRVALTAEVLRKHPGAKVLARRGYVPPGETP
ncbi:MAG: VWA domain-containing protein [Bryobacteraceae bacterium]